MWWSCKDRVGLFEKSGNLFGLVGLLGQEHSLFVGLFDGIENRDALSKLLLVLDNFHKASALSPVKKSLT